MPFQKPVGVKESKQTPPTFIRPLRDKRALIGQNIVLECQIEAHPDPVIKWLKDGHNVSQCPDYQLSEQGRNYRLTIPSAQAIDSGRFTIQAMNAAGIKQSTCILIVAPAPTPVPGGMTSIASSPAPPQTPVGPSAPFFLKELKHQPLRLGTPAVLEGRVVGQPQPEIEWFKNGEPLNNYRAKTEYDPQSGICTLTIPQAFAEDIGQYGCKASNAMGSAESTAQIMPQEQYDKWFSDEQRQVTKDKKQKLLQSARQQQQQQHQSRRTPSGYTPSPRSTPAYIQRQLDQWGPSGGAGFLSPASEMSDSQEISAAPSSQPVAMPPVFRNKLRGLRLTEGTDAVLQCNVIGVPKPKIYWLRNGRPLAPTPRSQTHYGGTMALLKISMMSPEDSGEYSIVAENQHGRAQSSAKVEVYPLSSTPAFDPLLSTLASTNSQQSHQQKQKSSHQSQRQQEFAEQPTRLAQQAQPAATEEQRSAERRKEPPAVPQKPASPQVQRQQAPQPFYQSPIQREQPQQQKQIYPPAAVVPVAQFPQQQRLPEAPAATKSFQQQQLLLQRDSNFRLRTPPKEYYHQQERVSRQPVQAPAVPTEQSTKSTHSWSEQLAQLSVQDRPKPQPHFEPTKEPAPPPVSLLVTYQPPPAAATVESSPRQIPIGTAVYRPAESVERQYPPKSKAEWEIDQWLRDPFGEQQSSPTKVHPYLRPLEQVEYLLQEQQRRQQKMAPPPQPAGVQKNGPMTNGTAAHPPVRQQQQQQQFQQKGASRIGENVQPPQFLEMPKPLAVKPGEKAVFTAKATGQPMPELTWMYLSQPQRKLAGEPKKFQITGGKDGQSQMTIVGVQEQDLGVYACVASNPGGSFQAQFALQFAGGGLQQQQQQQRNIQQQQQRGGSQQQNQQQYMSGVAQNAAQNLLKSSAGGAGSVRQKFQSPSPAPEQREQVTLKRVDRTKQFTTAKRPHLEDEQKAPSSQPPKFTSSLKSQSLVEGQHALLDCKFTPTDDPNLKVAWLLNGKPVVSTSRVTILNDFGYAVLEINPVTVFDHGEYTCVAVNTLGEDRQTATVEVLSHVALPPQQDQTVPSRTLAAGKDRPSFRIELRSQELFEGQPLNLETKLIPINDPSMKVGFYLNGNPVQSDGNVKCQYENGFVALSIEEISQKDAGYYVFQAENDIGQTETSATVVVVPRMDSSMYLAENENAIIDVEDMRELQSSQAAGQMHAPQFVQTPRDFHCEDELGRSYFDARVGPVNDPTLRVIWLKDGQPLPNANRIQLINNFGFVSLSIHPTYPEDQGTYTCLLRNSLGETSASAQLTTVFMDPLQLDPLHAEALPTIESIEDYRVHIGPVPVERPEELQSLEQPRFVRPLGGKVEVDMEEPVHFECRVQPANDVKMSVEWLLNGQPLAAAHRFRPMFDFGYVALDILYAYPEDSGTYTCIARNELGEAQSTIDLVVNTKQTLFEDPLHPEGLERIQELEQPRDFGLQEVPDRECDNPPKFLGNLQNVELQEGDEDLCFEIKLVPVNDPTMQVEWLLNGQPLYYGSRIHSQNDFGFITLTIRGVIPEDSGTYTVQATNEKGQDSRSCEVSVAGKEAILSAPQHEESLGKIEYLENLQKFVKPEIPEYEPTAPQFVEQLPDDVGEVEEGEPLHLECKVEPVGDNQLKVHWLRNGQPLPHAHRFRTFYDFGFVSLDILNVYAEDSGTYTCVAENSLGQAQTSTQFTCQPKSLIYTETQHPDSYARIQEIEAPKLLPEEAPEADKQAPFFAKPLSASGTEVPEGESVYLEAQYGPLDDNSLVCEWLLNGQPLIKANRFVLSQDFGFAALSILYMYPEDSGTYTLVIRNGQGQETSSSVDLTCGSKDALLLDTLHPDSVQRIAELEAPRPVPEEAPEPEKQAPQIVKQLTVTAPNSDGPAETQSLHFDAQFTPTDDNTVVIEWFHNGQPMMNSNRYHLTNDFGFAALDINFLLAEDAGEFTLIVSNAIGQAQTSASIQFEGSAVIIEDTQHPESLKRIQEIEAIRPAEPEPAEMPPEAPSFTQQLNGQIQSLVEGQPLHLDASVMPVTDPNLRIEWFFNGQPLAFSSRIRTIHDFGYVALEFGHLFAEDSGTYTCKAINEAGEAESSITIECESKRNLYLESQHEQSWAKIQEMENREAVKEPSPELHFPAPTFIVPLENREDLIEGDNVRLECRLQPVNDPTLKVFWTCNDQPLFEGNRFMPARNLDLVTLDIQTVYGEDSGVYTCRAVSDFGEAQTTATIKCQPTDALMLDVQHEQSWQQIQEIEARERPEIEMPEPEIVAPRFVQPLPSGLPEYQEGEPIHLEAQIEPTNDNQLVIEWFFNGQPLANAHRFRKVHDFGYVSLDILYSFAHDSGEYVCVARNALGEAQSQTSLQIATNRVLYLDPQHETSWQIIQEMEAPKPAPPEMEPPSKEAPQFIEQLQSLERIEGQPAHFQTRVTPVNDNQLRVQWFKDGQPLGDSNRFAFTNDFGLIALDLMHTVASDAGTYAVVATNEQGEAQVEGQLSVEPVSSLMLDPQHEQSWQRIQELEAPKEQPEAAADVEHGPPRFTQQLNSQTDLVEGQPAHFEAQVEPIADPNLQIEWFHNGHPLAASNRFAMRNDFGLVTLDIHYVLSQDIGDFRCVARNAQGEANTEGHLECQRRPDLYLDPQHEESWRRIQEMEAPKEPAPEPEPKQYARPEFIEQLQSQTDVPEGSVVLFEARVIPTDDPTLQIQWFRDDQPLMQSNRYAIGEEFGHVWLRVASVGLHDAGNYSCKAFNNEGEAMTNASLSVQGDERLILDTQHAESYARIQELEAMEKYPRLEYPEMEFGKPVWTKTFENVDVDTEGTIVQLVGHVEPAGDPNLKVEWSLNGVPLMNANRFRQECNFGEVNLFIIHVLPHDSGVYSCRAYNFQGEATTSATVKVAGYEALMLNTQHPESWDRIQELERPRIVEEIEIPEVKEKPRFLTQLESVDDVAEGTPIRLEATFQPTRDNELTINWEFNGQPLWASQLIRTRSDLGWAALDINGVNMDHVGVYTLKISNSEGEAASSASVKVSAIGDILGDTQHEESWRRIQQMEAPREKEPSPPPAEYDAPTFQQQISDIECDEGDVVKFEAAFMPNNDPNVKIQWVRNGVPLCHGSKFAIGQDFGYCTLAIGYTFPEDAGVYQLYVQNDKGEAVTSATLKCNPKESIIGDVQHEESWRRIQEMEAPKEAAPEPEPAAKQPPKFTSPVLTPGDVNEGQPAHFETTVEPIDDNEMRIQWYLNGAPVASSSRLKMISDFGWVILNIADCIAEDTGTWECVATNSVGEARASAQLTVQPKERLLLDPINQSSFAKIQEMEAPKEMPEEAGPAEYDAPQITAQLTAPSDLNEGDSAHLEARFTPVNDPNLIVEWYRDGQPIFHTNRHRMVSDFGFGILDILYLLAHDAGEYTLRVYNDKGEASTSVQLAVQPTESLHLQPMSENKAKAVQDLEDSMIKPPPEEEMPKEQKAPVFVSPLTGPSDCDQGDRAHFTARYEPIDDNQLTIQWYLNGTALFNGSRVKTINDFGVVVLEICPVYPEDSGEYVCKAKNVVGEATTSTQLSVTPKEGVEYQSQLPQSTAAGAQQRIHELETRMPIQIEQPEKEHGAPRFTTQFPSLPQLREGALIHIDAQLEPVDDNQLVVEWFHNGQPVRNTARMKCTHDFGFVALELSPAEPQDNGTWLCRATNAQGQAEIQCEIEVAGDSGISYEWVSPGERKERIEELEDWINRPKADLMAPDQEFEPPRFTQPLQDAGTIGETQSHAFSCTLEPVGDPSLKVEWMHNGQPLPYSNRLQLGQDFGTVTLLIKHLITQDSGEYTCIARSDKGEAQTTASIVVESIMQVDEPIILQPLNDNIDAVEGETVHLECRVAPINDPKLNVQWLRNGMPLGDANRYKQIFEFGFVTLDILYAYPEDNGDYELIVSNDKGEARTRCHMNVAAKPGLIFTPQAPGSNMVDNLEHHMSQYTNAALALSEADAWQPDGQQSPVFKSELNNVGVEEGDFCRFETQLAPINDPYMKVEWYKDGKPVLIGTRFRNTLDFGYVCLDLLYALPDDTGEYACVATNQFGQAMLTAKLACSAKQYVITQPQMPQGVRVKDVKEEDGLYWTETGEKQAPRQRQAPQFLIQPRNLQVVENMPARFECAVSGNPRPKIIWYHNGVQALDGHRFKLSYDGVHYLTLMHARISDVGTIEAIAKNTEGEVHSSASLDVFQHEDFRQHKLHQGKQRTNEELQSREQQWKEETLGQLGEAFEKAPKGDIHKLAKVELQKTPIEPLETEELVQKFTRAKDEQFYDSLAYVEKVQKEFPPCLELEPVQLKPGQVSRYQPVQEKLPEVKLRELGEKSQSREPEPLPNWASGEVKLGEPVGKFTQLDEPEPEAQVVHRDQVKFKPVKPKPKETYERFTIEEERARMAEPRQGPEIEPEQFIPHKDQVQIRQKFKPKEAKPHERGVVEGADKPLKDIPPVVKEEFEKSSVPSKFANGQQAHMVSPPPVPIPVHYIAVPNPNSIWPVKRPQPTKITPSSKAAPALSNLLQSAQAEIGRSASFVINYSGEEPVTVKWFHNGKQIRSAFDTAIRTTTGESRLDLSKLKESHAGEYSVKLENMAGQCESSASLSVSAVPDRGVAPQFSQRVADQRVQQGQTVKLSCVISGNPRPTISWFKDGKQLPNDDRYQQTDSDSETSLTIVDALPTDGGIYECVAKNPAGECRCKSRLNMILAKTGAEAEKGPKQEAPRFADTIKPVLGQENGNAEFRAKYTGDPEPTIRWTRNNQPIKQTDRVDFGNAEGDAWLRISGLTQEDVAEYKCEAVNPVGRASSVANLALKPAAGRVIGGKPGLFEIQGGAGKFGTGPVGATKSPQFLSPLNAINARQGENVKFVAEIDGDPLPTVQWLCNGKPVIAGGFQLITQEDNRVSLEIKKVTPSNAGTYMCQIRNQHGAAQSQASLSVQSQILFDRLFKILSGIKSTQ